MKTLVRQKSLVNTENIGVHLVLLRQDIYRQVDPNLRTEVEVEPLFRKSVRLCGVDLISSCLAQPSNIGFGSVPESPIQAPFGGVGRGKGTPNSVDE